MKKHEGFTLIELIIVIIILGILAAYAVPKYMSIDEEARKSVVKGLEGSVRAAADMVHAIAIAKGATDTVNIGSVDIDITTDKYPTATNTGINAALADSSGFILSISGSSAIFEKTGAKTPANCSVNYTIGNPPTISILISGCQ